jgi:hypothetical protein
MRQAHARVAFWKTMGHRLFLASMPHCPQNTFDGSARVGLESFRILSRQCIWNFIRELVNFRTGTAFEKKAAVWIFWNAIQLVFVPPHMIRTRKKFQQTLSARFWRYQIVKDLNRILCTFWAKKKKKKKPFFRTLFKIRILYIRIRLFHVFFTLGSKIQMLITFTRPTSFEFLFHLMTPLYDAKNGMSITFTTRGV